MFVQHRQIGVQFFSGRATRCFSQSSPDLSPRGFRPRVVFQDDNETRPNKMLRMLMFGKPGAGKGTLTSRLVKQFDIVSLSTGDLLRQHIAENTPIGLQAKDIVASGGFLPDDLMVKVVTSKLNALAGQHWILDGFPRTLRQAEMLDSHLQHQGTPLTLIVNLDVPDDVILSRISERFVHLKSGRVYNLSFNPPKVAGLDDITGEALTKRPDDNPEVFAHRLEKFYESTSPLLSYYTSVSTRTIPDAVGVRHRQRQHPHQIALPRHLPGHKLLVKTLQGTTSDQIWPRLRSLVTRYFPFTKDHTVILEARHLEHSLSDVVQGKGSLAKLRQTQ